MTVTAATFIARELKRLGVIKAFCLIGEANLVFIGALQKAGIELIHGRHEQGVVAIADGYARFSGNTIPAVCTVTQGPGLTNTTTSVITAANAGSRILLFAGDTSNSREQIFDQVEFGKTISRNAIAITSKEIVASSLQKLLDSFVQGQGMAIASVPVELWEQPLNTTASLALPKMPKLHPNPVNLRQAVTELKKWQRPAILAGRGAVLAGAEADVIRLAEKLGAAIVTTIASHGFAAHHPLYVGPAGTFGTGVGAKALYDADGILAIGTSLSHWTLDEYTVNHGKPLISVNLKASPLVASEIFLKAEAGQTVSSLLSEFEGYADQEAWFWPSSLPRHTHHHTAYTLDPWFVLETLNDLLPKSRPTIFDGGQHVIFGVRTIGINKAADFAWTGDFGSIGQGLGLAIGASFARPQERTILISGDCSFLMSIGELDTAVRHQSPLAIFVLNDQGYGQERSALKKHGIAESMANIATPDIAQLARAYGAYGYRIETSEELARIPSILASKGGPVVFDIRTNPAVRTDFLERLREHKQLAREQQEQLKSPFRHTLP